MFTRVSRYPREATLLVILLLALASSSTACTVTPSEVTPTPVEATPTAASERGTGGTLRLLHWEAPNTLNPHLAGAYKDWQPCRITYEPLASFDKDGNLVPFLAAESPSLENGGVAEDGLSVTWKLKQNVSWSDGQPFTADDVLFTYEYVTNPAVGATSAPTYDAVKDVQVIDDYTVRVNFKDVNPAWALPFVGIPGMILPRHVFEAYNGPNAQEAPANLIPVGTGPYRVLPPGIKPQEVLFLGSELVETNKIVYEPNPYFREADKPFFSRVEYRGGGTVKEAARLVMEDGWVHYAFYLTLPADELAELEDADKGRLVTGVRASVGRILLNRTHPWQATETGERSSLEIKHPFFNDLKVRQAFAHAIDRERIAALYGSAAYPTGNNLTVPTQYESPRTFYEFDLDRAKELLDEAGWVDSNGNHIRDKDGVEMRVVYRAIAGPVAAQTQQIVREALEELQIEVEVQINDSSVMFSSDRSNPNNAWRFNADMLEFVISSPSPDPGPYMQYWTSDQIPQQANNWSGNNFERWDNQAYDALYEQSTTEMDPEKRRQLFIQMNDLLVGDVVMIPIFGRNFVSGADRTLEGIGLTPWDAEVWNIKDWRRISQ